MIILIVAMLAIAGSVVGLAFAGIIQIPGITPQTPVKVVDASKNQTGGLLWTLTKPWNDLAKRAADADKAAKALAAKNAPPPETDAPKVDPDLGDEKLAALWNDLDVNQLISITKKWQPAPLAKVLAKMDSDAVTKYLNSLDAARADVLSRAIQTLASHPADRVGSESG
jgi:Mg/Co/Ni transporter MgtE